MSGEALEAVIRFHNAIRFAYLVGANGKLIASAQRRGIEGTTPDDVMKQFFVKNAIIGAMAEPENRYQGRTTSVIVNREKLRILVYPLWDEAIIVSTERGFPLSEVERLGMLVDCLDTNALSDRMPLTQGEVA